MVRFISTKSQIFSLDLVIAAIIFTTGLILFYKYSLDLVGSQQDSAGNLIVNANSLSNSLLSRGYPLGWNKTNVILIGICDNEKRINESKLTMFSELDYKQTRTLLSTHNDYYLFFESMDGDFININNTKGIGKPGVNATNIIDVEDPENIVKMYRYALYNSEIIRLGLYVW